MDILYVWVFDFHIYIYNVCYVYNYIYIYTYIRVRSLSAYKKAEFDQLKMAPLYNCHFGTPVPPSQIPAFSKKLSVEDTTALASKGT